MTAATFPIIPLAMLLNAHTSDWRVVSIVSVITIFGAIVAISWLVASTIRRVRVARLEAYSKLVDKVGSSPDFRTYLETDSGKELVASMALDHPRREPYSRILRSVRTGVILLALGVVFLIFATHFAKQSDGFLFFGGLGVALGAGFLISSWVSYGLSKKLGLINHNREIENPLP